ncbi:MULTISPECIES: DoxX family protein [Ramlibacter]|uniref:DoxX family membrane protein n=1 Tax=Ramlibacter pinisoli TaxID=2682844 RepID=A0A6N8IRG2_9BURK|nr:MULTISPECIES: DoxX family protein [Ramlibacter]MBA2964346.1 DoxX family protein [Ramlibacter sp. CGMCC 1.13660]MVQ29312.1 DoxX family membrane protein [Ramlibacter pinisoli]
MATLTHGATRVVTTDSSDTAQNLATLIGRVLLAWLFVPAGFGKIVGFAGTVGYIASKGVAMPEVSAALAIAAELGLGLLLLVGWRARWAALGLAVFVAVITPLFHNYWAVSEAQRMMQSQAFWKNMGVLGGLLFVWAFGPGGWSLDGARR